jgi:hypothetical protein
MVTRHPHFARVLLLAALLFASVPLADAGESAPLRILFVGNSLTYQNDLPRMVAGLARSRGHEIRYDVYAPGGYRLSQHATDPRLLEKIDRGGFDVVVLQEQSQLPAMRQDRLEREVFPFAKVLCDRIRATSPRTRIAFYQTMARRNGDAATFPDLPEVATYEGMQRRINAAYAQMARDNHGILLAVGAAWARTRAQEPALALYGDDVHPSFAGTYLAACVFFAALYGESPTGAAHPPGVDDATATSLQRLAVAR